MKLTIFCVQQHLIELGLIVIKGLSNVVYSLLISKVAVHETAKQGRDRYQKAEVVVVRRKIKQTSLI